MALDIPHGLQFLDPLAGARPPDLLSGPGDVYCLHSTNNQAALALVPRHLGTISCPAVTRCSSTRTAEPARDSGFLLRGGSSWNHEGARGLELVLVGTRPYINKI